MSKSATTKAAAPKPLKSKAATAKAVTSPAAETAETPVSGAISKTPLTAEETLKLILSRLDDMKAEETITIDLRGKSAMFDYVVVTSGRANRHVGAIAENVSKALKEAGVGKIHVEGLTNCDWVLMDCGDVVVHVFRPEVREFYNLERLWTQGPQPAKTL